MKVYVIEVFDKATEEKVGYIARNSEISKFLYDAVKYDIIDVHNAYNRALRLNADSLLYRCEVKSIEKF